MQLNAVRTLTVRGQSQGLDKVKADLVGVSEAQEKVTQTSETMARTTETTSRRQLSAGREFQRLVERNDRLVYLQSQLGKEMTVVNRAFEQGAIDALRHAQAVQMVETRYRGLVTAEERARATSLGLSAATDQQVMSMNRLAAANDNARGSTANIAAQFQDIGVTAAMGMSPIMIALQQGTQLSAVLSTMQNPIKGLAAALMSVISPVSLLTIGFIALAAVAIQWFMGAKSEAEKASSALEKHNEWLDKLLRGYDSVRDAAREAAEAASRMPAAVIASDLEQSLRAQEAALDALAVKAQEVQDRLAAMAGSLRATDRFRVEGGGEAIGADVIKQVEALANLELSAASTREEVEAFMSSARQIRTATTDSGVRELADQVFALGEGFLNLDIQQASTETAQFQMNMDRLSSSLGGAVAGMRASYDAAVVASSGYIQAANAAIVYSNSLASLGARIPAVAAQQQALAEMEVATGEWKAGVKALDDMAISADEMVAKRAELDATFASAKNEITGLATETVNLDRAERDAYVGSLPAKEAAIARLTDQHAARVETLQASIDKGAEAASVEDQIARSASVLEQEIANVNTQFAATEAKAGGAAKAVSAAEKEFNSLASTADGLAEKMFPGEYARREAEELSAALAQYGDSLDTFQRQAVEARIGDQFKAAGLNVRELEDTTKDAATNMGDTLFETIGSALSEIFKGGIKDADDLFEHLASGFAGIADQNFQALFAGMGGQEGAATSPQAVGQTIKDATEKGTSNGIFAGFDAWFGEQTGQNGTGAGSTMLGAAAGGFSTGYQAQDPLMGALGGAMQGWGAGAAMGGVMGPVGAVVGGLAGLIGGMFGAAKAAKEAQQALEKMRGEIDNLIDVGEGRGLGENTKAFREFADKSYEYQEAAAKAKDGELQKRLQNAVNSFFTFLNTDFKLSFQGTIDALNSGEGLGGAFVSAQQEIISMREELKGFVADTQFMNEKFGELAMIDWANETAAAVAEAQKATQSYALSVLAGAHELTEFEEGVAEAAGRASALQVTLEQLGMSATAAAEAITGALNMALAKLKDDYLADLNSSINDLSGFGFLNDITEAQKTYQDRLRDSAALGLDGSLALREFNLSLADIVQGADLTQTQIDMLAKAFPAMAGLIETVAGQDAMATVADARAELQRAYDAEASAINDVISRTERFITSIKDFRDSMRLDESSPLGQEQQFLEAQRQYRETLALANGGDEEAMGRLTDVSQAYLDEAREYYASSEKYAEVWFEIDRTLGETQIKAVSQLDIARSQLSALDASVAGILNLNSSVLTVAQAIAALAAAQAGSDAALQAQIAATQNQGANQIQEYYRTILGRTGSAAEIGWYANSGKSMKQIEADLIWAKQHGALAMGGIVGRYQTGGLVGNGIYDVDSVLARYAGGGNIALAGGEHVTRATSVNSTTRPMLDHINRTGQAPSNDNGDVVAELRAVRAELAELKSEVARQTSTIVLSDDATRELQSEGNRALSTMSKSSKRDTAAHTRKAG